MSDAPSWMPFYVTRYRSDCDHLTTLEHGAYLLLIINYWERQKPLDDDPLKLGRLARVTPDEWRTIEPILRPLFATGDGFWRNKRIDKEIAATAEKIKRSSAAGRASAERRANARSTPVEQPLTECSTIDIDIDTNRVVTDANASVVDAERVTAPLLDFEKQKKERKAETLRQLGEGWNKIAAELGLASIEQIKPGSTRERDGLARAREMISEHGGVSEGMVNLCVRIRAGPLLRGEVGHGWKATFDWTMKAQNFQKVMEGNYEVRKNLGR